MSVVFALLVLVVLRFAGDVLDWARLNRNVGYWPMGNPVGRYLRSRFNYWIADGDDWGGREMWVHKGPFFYSKYEMGPLDCTSREGFLWLGTHKVGFRLVTGEEPAAEAGFFHTSWGKTSEEFFDVIPF